MTIKAIETQYAGCRFRSRLEARWAVFFDHIGYEWQYEPEGFELDSGRYLPDFYLPEHQKWVEVKGDISAMSERDWARASEFAHEMWQKGHRYVVVSDLPRPTDMPLIPTITFSGLPSEDGTHVFGPLRSMWVAGGDVAGGIKAARAARFGT